MLTDQNIFVSLLFPIRLPVQVDLDRVDGGQVMEIKMLAPEAQISLQLGSRSRVQGAIEADLAKISLLCWHALRLQ